MSEPGGSSQAGRGHRFSQSTQPNKTKTKTSKSDPMGSSQAGSGHMSTQLTRPSKTNVTSAHGMWVTDDKASKTPIAGALKCSQNVTYTEIGDPACKKPCKAPATHETGSCDPPTKKKRLRHHSPKPTLDNCQSVCRSTTLIQWIKSTSVRILSQIGPPTQPQMLIMPHQVSNDIPQTLTLLV